MRCLDRCATAALADDRGDTTRRPFHEIVPDGFSISSLDVFERKESLKGPDGGTIYHSRWELANFDGPPPRPGVTRVTINEGSWLLEPIGNQTRATYTLYTDGGGISALLLNFANKQSVSRLFDALHTDRKSTR